MLDRRLLKSVLWEVLAPLMRAFVAPEASLSRVESAAVMGIGESLFDELARKPDFPRPWIHGRKKVWLKSALLEWQHRQAQEEEARRSISMTLPVSPETMPATSVSQRTQAAAARRQ